MAEQLGKIEKPNAESFKNTRKLYLVPLVYCGKDAPPEYTELATRYWQQTTDQLDNLETKIGKTARVYHELLSTSGEEGLHILESLNTSSCQIARNKCQTKAVLEASEDRELVEETMDCERCFLFGFASKKVAHTISELYSEASKKRYEFIAKKINETLKENEAGLLFIREGHGVQFAKDIEVFSVYPPVLNEIHRWLRDNQTPSFKKERKESSPKNKSEDKPKAKPRTRKKKAPSD